MKPFVGNHFEAAWPGWLQNYLGTLSLIITHPDFSGRQNLLSSHVKLCAPREVCSLGFLLAETSNLLLLGLSHKF